MWSFGDEMGHSKQGIRNTHNLPNAGLIDWSKQQSFADLLQFASKLNAFRASMPHFAYQRGLSSQDITWVMPNEDKSLSASAVGFSLRPPMGTPGRKKMPEILVLMNSHPTRTATFKLPRSGDWKVIADGESLLFDNQGLRTAAGTYNVKPGTGIILSKNP